MLLESLILYTCAKGVACTDTTTAYYKYNKDLQYAVHSVEKYGDNIAKQYPSVVFVATPIYTLTVVKKASFKVYKTVMFEVNIKDESLGLRWSY